MENPQIFYGYVPCSKTISPEQYTHGQYPPDSIIGAYCMGDIFQERLPGEHCPEEYCPDTYVSSYSIISVCLTDTLKLASLAEPVISEGGAEFDILDDGWTAVTRDDSRTAQFEHTILITKDGPIILTA